jgi:Ran GTPase-activating protein (RanGAP) involved in mRNA processing and transport
MGNFLSCTKKKRSIPYIVDKKILTIDRRTSDTDFEEKDFTEITTLRIDELPSRINIESLFQKLRACPLTKISINDVELGGSKGDDFYAQLSTLLNIKNDLTKITLENCDLTLERLKTLAPTFIKQTRLEKLNLLNNAFSDGYPENNKEALDGTMTELAKAEFSQTFELRTGNETLDKTFNDMRPKKDESPHSGP